MRVGTPGALQPLLENFRPAFSPDTTDCPWVSEDGLNETNGSIKANSLSAMNTLKGIRKQNTKKSHLPFTVREVKQDTYS